MDCSILKCVSHPQLHTAEYWKDMLLQPYIHTANIYLPCCCHNNSITITNWELWRYFSLSVKRFERVLMEIMFTREDHSEVLELPSSWRYLFCPFYLRKWFTASESSHCGKMDWGKSIPNLTLWGQEIDLWGGRTSHASSLCFLRGCSKQLRPSLSLSHYEERVNGV